MLARNGIRNVGLCVLFLLLVHFVVNHHLFHLHLTHHTPHHTRPQYHAKDSHIRTTILPHNTSTSTPSEPDLPFKRPKVEPKTQPQAQPKAATSPAQSSIPVSVPTTAANAPEVSTKTSKKDKRDFLTNKVITKYEGQGEGHFLWGHSLPPAPASVLVTFGSKSVQDFILNWVANVDRIPELRPYIVACMDKELLKACEERGIPAFFAKNSNIIGDRNNLGTQPTNQEKQSIGSDRYYRTDGAAFKKMGAVKAGVLENMLMAGYDVLISDADTVWFGNPWPIIGRIGYPNQVRADSKWLAQADILVSSDCIDFDDDNKPGLIGHEHNTGILFLRSSNNTIAFTREWQKRALETTDGHDQTEFNRILKGIYYPGRDGKAFQGHTPWPWLPSAISTDAGGDKPTNPDDYLNPLKNGQHRTVKQDMSQDIYNTYAYNTNHHIRTAYWMWHATVKVGILPLAEFMNGHMFFTRRLQDYSGIKPIVVHLTYQFGDTADYVYGKRQRLREHGIWAMEENSYFEEGSFLSIVNVLPNYDQIIAPYKAIGKTGVCRDSDPVKEKCWHPQEILVESKKQVPGWGRNPEALSDPSQPHLEVQGWLRGVLRNGILLSRILNQKMILPALRCWCERHWWLLDDCRIAAGKQAMPMPYECAMDHIFEPSEWYRHKVDFREPRFLEDPRVPLEVHTNKVHLHVDLDPGSAPIVDGNVVRLPRGITYAAAQRTLAEVQQARPQGVARIVEINAEDLLEFSTCMEGKDAGQVWGLNSMFMQILGGFLVEFCSAERNILLQEVAPIMIKQGKDVKEGLNCSYPGKWPVTANPVLWAKKITNENRQAWIGQPLVAPADGKRCPV